jgi:hypothetical protein
MGSNACRDRGDELRDGARGAILTTGQKDSIP